MNIKVEVLSSDLNAFEIDGKIYRQQTIWLHEPNKPYPTECRISIRESAYPPGNYVLDAARSLRVYKGKIQVGPIVLSPLPKQSS